jgi:hypothetical protein
MFKSVSILSHFNEQVVVMSQDPLSSYPVESSPELREMLRSALVARGYRLNVDFRAEEENDGIRLVVSGTVPSYHLRQIVLDCARRSVQGHVFDSLQVHSSA